MSVQILVASELQRIAAQGRGTLQVDTGKGELRADVVAVDAIGCAFESFGLQTDKLAGVSLDRIKKISASLSTKLNYLLEPISPIESDAESCTMQMRSMPPQQGDSGSVYYELLVRRGGSLTLQRYQAAGSKPRQAIAAQVTREVFQRLAEDFVAVIG